MGKDTNKEEMKLENIKIENYSSLHEVIKLMEKPVEAKDKHSIPDIYGRPIQLEITLRQAKENQMMLMKMDKKNITSTEQEIITWRGILTILALKDFRDLNVKIESVKYLENNSGFDKALRMRYREPSSQRIDDTEADFFYFITVNNKEEGEGIDIALFYPGSIFFPVAEIEKKIPYIQNIEWFDYSERIFINPTNILSDTEKKILIYWLNGLEAELKARVNYLTQEIVEVLLYHLVDFKKELSSGIQCPNNANECFKFVNIISNNANGLPDEVDALINKTVIVQLQLSQNYIVGYKEIFSEQLYSVSESSTPFQNVSHVECYSIQNTNSQYAFLPFSKRLIRACENNMDILEYLISHFHMELKKEQGEKLYIHAVLSLAKDSQNLVDVDRKYYLDSFQYRWIQEKAGDFPSLAVWPSKAYEEWKSYYIFKEGGKNGEINIDDLSGTIIHSTNPYVWKATQRPNAVPLNRKDEAGVHDIGVVIIGWDYDSYSPKGTINRTAIVAVDFGTSGTTVYVKDDITQDIQRIDVNHISDPLFLTKSTPQVKNIMNKYFVTSGGEKGDNLYSIYRRAKPQMIKDVKPILDGIIYRAQENEIIAISKCYMPDIKWQQGDSDVYFAAFIEELCLSIWETLHEKNVTDIELRYAFPKSMDTNHQARLNELWKKDILDGLKDNVTTPFNVGSRIYTESEAASLYFRTAEEIEAVNVDKGYIVVDIGGGSIDIAVWQRPAEGQEVTMVAQTSVAVAGRALFDTFIALNLSRIKELVFNDNEDLKNHLDEVRALSGNLALQNAIIERIVNYWKKDIMKNYRQKTDWATKLKRQLQLGMALLFFSLGSLSGYLKLNNHLKWMGGRGNFGIAVGGNGSKILDWINIDDNDKNNLIAMFKAGIESRSQNYSEINPTLIVSKRPKEEVAYGMLQDGNGVGDGANLKEQISHDSAIEWNRDFIENYNIIYNEDIEFNEDEIENILSNIPSSLDICNFFMKEMYINYYQKKVKEIK